MEKAANLGALTPLTTSENEQIVKTEDNKENDRKPQQPAEEGNSLTEKAKEVFNSAAEKTKEIAHHVKEKLTGVDDRENEYNGADVDEDVRESDDFVNVRGKPGLGENEDIFARKENEARRKFNEEQFLNLSEKGAMKFSEADELHAEQAQNIALEHAKQD